MLNNARISRMFGLVALVVGLAACSPPATEGPAPTANAPAPSQETLPKTIDIGDVETSMYARVNVWDGSRGAGVRVFEHQDARKELTRVIADIDKPYPERLWLTIKVGGLKNFPGQAVVAVPRIFINDKQIERYQFVTGPNAMEEEQLYEVDFMQHMDGVSDSALVHAKVDLTLLENKDVAEVSPEDAENAPANQKATLISNTLRINFKSGE